MSTTGPFFSNEINEAIKKIGKNDPRVTRVLFDSQPLTKEQIKNLMTALKKNTHVTYLNLFDCGLQTADLQLLLTVIKENTNLQEVILNHYENAPDAPAEYKAVMNEINQAIQHNVEYHSTLPIH